MSIRWTLGAIAAALLSMAPDCGGVKLCDAGTTCDCLQVSGGQPVYVPCTSPSPSEPPSPPPATPTPCPSATPCPSPTPCPACPDICKGVTCFLPDHVCVDLDGEATCIPRPEASPSPGPSPSPSPSPEPSPEPTPTPTPVPTPPPLDCSKFKPTETGWSILACTKAGKLVCGGGQGKKCDCSGAGCTFTLPVDSACDGDSTPRHNGELPNWKTCTCLDHGDELPCNEWPLCVDGKVERSEYPPRPAYGWECAGTTKWTVDPGVSMTPEGDGYGARLKFTKAGTFKIRVCRADGSKCTEKKARIQ